MTYDVIIIGAGPAGMTAAIYSYYKLNNVSAKIMIIDKNKKVGRKLYATGNGKCNLGNTFLDLSCYECHQEFFPYEIIDIHSYERITEYMNSLGVSITNINGYLYPSSMQASSVVWAMSDKLKELGIYIHLKEECIDISYSNKEYTVTTDIGIYNAHNVILAPGGCASGKLGGSRSVYNIVNRLNLNIYEPYPGLCKLVTVQDISMLSGVRVKAKASLVVNGNEYISETGELQFTDNALSGILIFNLSLCVNDMLVKGKRLLVNVELLPDITHDDIIDFFTKAKAGCPNRTLHAILNGLINEKLAKYIILKLNDNNDICDIEKQIAIGNKFLYEISDEEIITIANTMKKLSFDICSCGSFDEAQVTSGGIDTCLINPSTCEVYGYNGLFIAGEYMDVAGKCGGYNIMWAIATGMKAGDNIR